MNFAYQFPMEFYFICGINKFDVSRNELIIKILKDNDIVHNIQYGNNYNLYTLKGENYPACLVSAGFDWKMRSLVIQ